jgi:hypothetical protein
VTLVDSNILIDIFSDDPDWFDWSSSQLEAAALDGPLFINDVVYTETSIRYREVQRFEAALGRAGVVMVPIPHPALFAAGKAFENTAKPAVHAPASCPTSSSARMPRSSDCRC